MKRLPKGFYVTGREMLDAGLRVHETMENYRFVAETVEQVETRAAQVKARIERLEADGKDAERRGDNSLARMLREEHAEAKAVLEVWRQRWRDMSAAEQAEVA